MAGAKGGATTATADAEKTIDSNQLINMLTAGCLMGVHDSRRVDSLTTILFKWNVLKIRREQKIAVKTIERKIYCVAVTLFLTQPLILTSDYCT